MLLGMDLAVDDGVVCKESGFGLDRVWEVVNVDEIGLGG